MFEMTSPPSWLAGLNEAQRTAATHGDGPLLVIAGAGTGKTKTLVARVAHLIATGTAPQRILLLTFTRRASKEMLSRAARAVRDDSVAGVWGGTFHSMANRLLRMNGRAIGVDPQFTVLDQGDAGDLMNLARTELELGGGPRRFPRKDTLLSIYSAMVNSGTKLGEVLEGSFPWCAGELDGIRSVFEVYTERKRRQSVLDYDDLLLFWRALARSVALGDLFDHVLVDEYQDTNSIQCDILKELRRTNSNLTVVGDDAQAIYSFRSASVENIFRFPDHFAGARVVPLEQNYRSVQPILDVTNSVIADARHGYEKRLWSARANGAKPSLVTCWDETQQTTAVCGRILEAREEGTSLRRQAVLFRAAHHSAMLEIELARRSIPFVKFGGLKFLEAAHVKDALSFLRVLENPRDELSWFRLLLLVEGIGPKTARRVLGELGLGDGHPGVEGGGSPLDRLLDRPPVVPPAATTGFATFVESLSQCTGPDLAPAAQIERVRSFFEPIFARVYDAAPSRLRDLEQLEKIASGYSSRGRFISELTLDPPASTGDLAGPPLLDEDYLTLSTIHSAKGCEWDTVHVLHAADGMIPSDMATGDELEVEEERRVFYVALTRARSTLTLYFPLRYYHRPSGTGDAHSYAQLTRFISPATRSLLVEEHLREGMEEVVELSGTAGAAGVDDFLAGLWS